MVYIPSNHTQVAASTGASMPLAQGVNVSGLGGQALQQAGQSIQHATSVAAMIGRQNQHDADAAWTSEVTSKAIQDFNQYSIQQEAAAKGPATGYSDEVKKYVYDYKKNLIDSAPNEQSKKFIAQSLDNVATHVIIKAQNFEYDAYKGNTLNQLDMSRDIDAKTTAMFPDMAVNLYKKQIGIIDGTNLHDTDKYKLKKKAQEEIWGGYDENRRLNDTVNYFNELSGLLGTKHPEGSIQNKVAQAAEANGIDKLTALTIMGSESGPKLANAKNNESSAHGLFQFTDATWKDYGGTAENRNDPDTQIKLGIKYLKDRQNELTVQLGRKPTATELKIGHMFRGNAVDILQSSPDTPIADIIGDKAAYANHLEGKTTGEVVTSLDKNVHSQMASLFKGNQNKTDNFIFNSATLGQVTQAFEKTRHVMQQKNAQDAFLIEQKIKDDQAQVMDGKTPTSFLTRENFNSIAPNNPAKADALYGEYMDGIKTGQLYNQIKYASIGETNNLRESFARDNDPSKPGYATRQHDLHILDTAIAHKQEALKTDPANYVMQQPLIQQKVAALQNAKTPEAQSIARNDLYSSMVSSQRDMGVGMPRILTKGEENQIIGQIQNLNGLDLAKYLKTQAANYGVYWPTATRQLQQNNAFPDDAISILIAPNEVAMERAAALSKVKIEDLKGLIQARGKSENDVSTAVNEQMKQFYSSIPVEQLGGKVNNALQSTITKSVYDLVSKGQSVNTAAKTSYNMFVGGDRYNYLENKGGSTALRVPKQYNIDLVTDNAKQIPKNLTINDVDVSHANILTSPWTGKPDISGYLDRIKSNSIWYTNGDESGAKLFFMGNDNLPHAVIGKDGRQIERSFNSLSVKR